MNKKLAAAMALLMSTTTFAGGLGQPISLPSAKVLPKGVRNFTFKGIVTNPEKKFDGNGNNVVLADPLMKKITFGDISYLEVRFSHDLIGGPAPVAKNLLRHPFVENMTLISL